MSAVTTTATTGRTASARSRRAGRAGLVVAGYAAFLAVWQALSGTVFTPYILPPPTEVAGRLWELTVAGTTLAHFASSIGKIATGFALAVVLGAPIGVLMGRSRFWRAFFHDPVMVAGNVPGLTYAVFGLVLFGIGSVGPIVAVTLVAMPYVALNVAEGVQAIDGRLLAMSEVYGRSFRSVTRHVIVPSVAPFVFAAVRYGFAMAWKVEALTEVFGGDSGIGFMIRRSYQEFDVAAVLAWTFFFVIVMVLIERVVLARVERRFFRWRDAA